MCMAIQREGEGGRNSLSRQVKLNANAICGMGVDGVQDLQFRPAAKVSMVTHNKHTGGGGGTLGSPHIRFHW